MTHDLYGLECNDLEVARDAIEKAIHVTMALHEYDSYGGDYYRASIGSELFVLRRNLEIVHMNLVEIAEEEFPDVPILLDVDNTNRPEEIERLLTARLPGIELLRRETW